MAIIDFLGALLIGLLLSIIILFLGTVFILGLKAAYFYIFEGKNGIRLVFGDF